MRDRGLQINHHIRTFLAAWVVLLFAGAADLCHAATCDGQKGAVIFEDTFADDLGGWVVDPDLLFKGQAVAHIDPKYDSDIYLNNSFNAKDGDYCTEIVVPQAISPTNSVTGGLIFWAADTDNFFLWQINSAGDASLWKQVDGKWAAIAEGLKTGATPGSIAALRVVASGGVLSLQVNGTELKKTRAPVPSGNPRFGIYAETDDNPPAPGIDVLFKRFKVTTGK